MDLQTLLLALCGALLATAVAALVAARSAKVECAALRREGLEALRGVEAARGEAQAIRARAEEQAKAVEDRDRQIAQIARQVEDVRQKHGEAERRCAEAEARCATATEAVARLEALERRLRVDAEKAAGELRADIDRLTGALRDAEDRHAGLSVEHRGLKERLEAETAAAQREVERLREIRKEMSDEFQALSARMLQETGSQFSEAHQQRLEALLNPFREQVRTFETELREVHQSAGRDRAVLVDQIRELTTRTEMVSKEAVNLTRALKGEKQRQGAWGEAQLEQYLDHMGYVKGVHYSTQETRTGESGNRLRPDVILKMPGGRSLIIDSKVSLAAYAAAIGAEDEAERARHLRDHVKAVKARIDELASKEYQRLDEGAVEWVLLFMPIEGAVSAAWAHEADIAAYAMERRIGIAYPTTLLMALRTVRHLWDIDNRNRNAEAIADRAGRLHDKLLGFVDSFEAVGKALGQASAAHERAWGQLNRGSGNLMGQVDKLRKLGAKTGKAITVAFEAEPDDEETEAPRILGLPEPDPQPAPGVRPAE
ncbi:DNA recombination protein RmuC [Rubellimicrobium roseum]|uniref:DNA recombination protein RmuC homolog n=1 Tax=Rubellimicrobium roseum TaxID=687525 RepID=A0A5C4NCB5_9RHOB|nr:DNA recombination protein RmuC [Rubellimicrobium roseum]TNC71535.1 DNA recombination protein RmuC [Rubellimicrobium roseum]